MLSSMRGQTKSSESGCRRGDTNAAIVMCVSVIWRKGRRESSELPLTIYSFFIAILPIGLSPFRRSGFSFLLLDSTHLLQFEMFQTIVLYDYHFYAV